MRGRPAIPPPPLCKNFTRYLGGGGSSSSSKKGRSPRHLCNNNSGWRQLSSELGSGERERNGFADILRETVFSGPFFERDFAAAQGGKKAYTIHMNRLSVSILIVLYL